VQVIFEQTQIITIRGGEQKENGKLNKKTPGLGEPGSEPNERGKNFYQYFRLTLSSQVEYATWFDRMSIWKATFSSFTLDDLAG
jgi:hypothetical protein